MPERPNKAIRVGLVGAGYVSRYHIRALRSLGFVELVGIADLDSSRAQEVARSHRIPHAVRDLEELGSFGLDAVHVLTPPASHCAVTLAALEIGCHVLVEKPMASSVEECDLMMAKAVQVGRILSVNHSARFDPAFQKVLQVIRSGALGDILSADYSRSSDYPPYAGGRMPPYYGEGGYPFRDLGVHGLYLLEAVLGEIRHLDAHRRSTGRLPHLLFDEWRAVVECERGSGQVQLSWNSRPTRNTLFIQGTRGAVEVDFFLEKYAVHRNFPGPKVAGLILNAVTGSVGTITQTGWSVLRFASGSLPPSPDIHHSVRRFYQALEKGDAPPVSPDEGRRMVEWVEQAARPADAEKIVVQTSKAASKPCSILVTGGTGFLGRALVKRLIDAGEVVRLLVRRRPPEPFAQHPHIELVFGDLGDPAAVDAAVHGVALVYHVGAAMNGGWEEYAAGTIGGTQNIVDACLRHGVTKLVYVSSQSVLDYAALRKGASIDESFALEPHPDRRGHYTKAKLQAEQIVRQAIQDRSLPAVIARPGQIFGPGAEHVPPYGIIALGNRWIVMGSGRGHVPLVYIDDVVDALVACAARAPNGSLVHVVDPAILTQDEYLKVAMEKLVHVRLVHAPMWLLYCAATGLELLGRLLRRPVPLTWYRLRSIRDDLRFDFTAARQLIGWTPRVGVRAGLVSTFTEHTHHHPGRASTHTVEAAGSRQDGGNDAAGYATPSARRTPG